MGQNWPTETWGSQIITPGPPRGGDWHGAVHEQWQIEGNVGILRHPIFHYPHPTMVEFLQEINHYSSLRAQELHAAGQHSSLFKIVFYAPAKFLWLWLCRWGFLDGTAGFVHAMTMAFTAS